ncbi:TetR family transcriptional regulator [Pendulispora rubella]|uniref:TetR family transcriptional regulator n=1 Tax=Pendulispora rubella TaxID=2741070 RepID=A0ABZ2L0T3_9BACT
MTMVDGRKLRGDRKREALIHATLRLVERDGLAGITHRRVANEAGVPTASTTYHFASLDDLLVATLTWCADEFAVAVGDRVARAGGDAREEIRALAEMIAEALGPGRGRLMAEYELYLLAARRPALRPAARRWADILTTVVQHDDNVAFRAFVAGLDGLLMQGMIRDTPPTVEELEPLVASLMRSARGQRS